MVAQAICSRIGDGLTAAPYGVHWSNQAKRDQDRREPGSWRDFPKQPAPGINATNRRSLCVRMGNILTTTTVDQVEEGWYLTFRARWMEWKTRFLVKGLGAANREQKKSAGMHRAEKKISHHDRRAILFPCFVRQRLHHKGMARANVTDRARVHRWCNTPAPVY